MPSFFFAYVLLPRMHNDRNADWHDVCYVYAFKDIAYNMDRAVNKKDARRIIPAFVAGPSQDIVYRFHRGFNLYPLHLGEMSSVID
jgi:hypothetical protein